MNPTIIKEVWYASWEMRLIMLAGLVAGLTGNDIAPYVGWMPLMIGDFLVQYWNLVVLAAAAYLRAKKTSTKLVLTSAQADSPEVIAAAKASVKTISPSAAAAAAATLKAYEDQRPKA